MFAGDHLNYTIPSASYRKSSFIFSPTRKQASELPSCPMILALAYYTQQTDLEPKILRLLAIIVLKEHAIFGTVEYCCQ